MEESLREKREWEEYEQHLYHICRLLPPIMQNYISNSTKSLSYTLDILLEVTKLSESVVALDISTPDFFLLLEKLNAKGGFGGGR